MTPAEQIHEKILHIKLLMDEQHPGLEGWLRDIHSNLKKDESLVQCLTPEEVGQIVAGLSIVTRTKIVKEAVASKSTKAKLGQLSLTDI
jgi:hypothetical protein